MLKNKDLRTGKIVPIGGSLGVTLPIAWCKKHNIRPGDSVVKVGNSLLVISIKAAENEGNKS